MMRILIYGAGVIGSLFAGKLALAGFNVTMLARGDRYTNLDEHGLILRDDRSGRSETVPMRVIRTLAADDVYDYVIVTMKKNQVGAVLPMLSGNRSPAIVFVVNNPLGYDDWVKAVGKDRLMLGFPSAGGVREGDAVRYFIGKGFARLFQTTTFGEYDGSATPRLGVLIGAFRKAGIPAVMSRRMDAWQKTHVAIVTAIADALYHHRCDAFALTRNPHDLKRMIRAIHEGFAVLRALGYRVTPGKLHYFDLPAAFLTPLLRVFMRTQAADIAMVRHTVAAVDEMILLQHEFDILIDRAGIPTPAIDEQRRFLPLADGPQADTGRT